MVDPSQPLTLGREHPTVDVAELAEHVEYEHRAGTRATSPVGRSAPRSRRCHGPVAPVPDRPRAAPPDQGGRAGDGPGVVRGRRGTPGTRRRWRRPAQPPRSGCPAGSCATFFPRRRLTRRSTARGLSPVHGVLGLVRDGQIDMGHGQHRAADVGELERDLFALGGDGPYPDRPALAVGDRQHQQQAVCRARCCARRRHPAAGPTVTPRWRRVRPAACRRSDLTRSASSRYPAGSKTAAAVDSVVESRRARGAVRSADRRATRSLTDDRSAWNWANERPSTCVRRVAVVAVHEVRRHVVRRTERRRERELAAGGQGRHLGEVTNGDHNTTAEPRSSIPRRPARPVSWVNCDGVRYSWLSPLNFVRRSITTERAGMLIPSASVSVANTTLTRPSMKQSSTASRKAGIMPAWCDGDAHLERGHPSVVAEHVEVGVGQGPASAPRPASRIRDRSSASVRRSPASRHCAAASSQPARLKMK